MAKKQKLVLEKTFPYILNAIKMCNFETKELKKLIELQDV